MPLQAFSFPIPETRFFRAGSCVFKFKIRGGNSFSRNELTQGKCFNQELEEIIRTVLGNLNNLQPFSSPHFSVFPYKRQWEAVSHVIGQHNGRNLKVYPFLLVLYLEKNMLNSEDKHTHSDKAKEREKSTAYVLKPQLKRWRSDSSLEDAILKDLMDELEAESRASVVSLLDARRSVKVRKDKSHPEEEVKEDSGRANRTQRKGVTEFQVMPGDDIFRLRQEEVAARSTENKQDDERENNNERENTDPVSVSPASPGILTQMCRKIFPFSWFFRDV